MKALLSRVGRSLGLEVRLSGPAARDDLRLARFLADQAIDLVLDVGANRGQFAQGLFEAGFSGRVVSFEALPSAHAELTANARARPETWRVAPAVALSDREGEAEFFVNYSDATSSLLPPSRQSIESIAGLQPAGAVRVMQRRLDDFSADYEFAAHRSFLKIDVQGGERLVLAGAAQTLREVVGLVVEVSFVPLYEGQPLAFEIVAELQSLGFQIYDVAVAYRDSDTFQLIQADIVLFHPDRMVSGRHG